MAKQMSRFVGGVMTTYIETDCIVEHEGRSFEAGGAIVTPDVIVAYPSKDGVLTDWRGKPLGTWRATRSWRVRSYMGSRMYQISATVNGAHYTGRGFGEGMSFNGRRVASERSK